MRTLKLLRDVFQPDLGDRHGWTLGRLLLDGLPLGFTVEDVDRGLDAADPASLARKVKGRTAIPVGTYAVGVRYSPKHAREVLYLRDVPGFQFIEIHSGNGEADTDGCVLPGLDRTGTGVARSRDLVAWMERELMAEARASAVRIVVERDVAAWTPRSSAAVS